MGDVDRATTAGRTGNRWGMTRARLVAAHLAIGLLLVGSAYDIARGREHWPFSCYPMYSRLELEKTMTQLRIFGVAEGTGGQERLLRDRQYLDPFDNSRLGAALRRIRRSGGGDRPLRDALRYCLGRYEWLRRRGRHDGPALEAIRLYELTWELDPRAANADRPNQRRLIAEARVTPGGSEER